MNDLISRKSLKEELLRLSFTPAIVVSAIDRMPAVDTIEVVRCKNCKHYERGECYHERHNHHSQSILQNEDDFCSCGERRETNEAD